MSSAPIRIGSQLIINRDDTPATVRRFVRQMAKARLRLIRLFIAWDHVEPRANHWTWEPYDSVFAAAAECDMFVVPTLMSVSPPGWMRCTQGPQAIGPLEDPEFIRHSEDYLRRVVERWRDSCALDSWILWNEPDRVVPRTPETMRAFADFLRERYAGDIARYNRASYRQFEDFEQVYAALAADRTSPPVFGSRIDQLEWVRFSVVDVVSHLRRIAATVRSLDPAHPVHINPHKVSQCRLQMGQSIWQEGDIADFMGCSAHPVWHSTRFPRDRWHQSVAMFADLMRSCTRHPEELFWVSELQGGTTVFSGTTADGPTGLELNQWLWESIGAGARAVVYWCFNWRTDGYEAGEWSLLGQDGQPSERVRATERVASFLERHGDLFQNTRPPEPEVLVLYSEPSLLLGLIEGTDEEVGNPRNRQMAADAICGAYLMAADLGREVRFIDERLLRERRWPASATTLLVPGCVVLEAGSLDGLHEFARAGGTVIADHLLGWKTSGGSMAAEGRQRLRDLFGADLQDVRGVPREFWMQYGKSGRVPGWFTRLVFSLNHRTSAIAHWENGEAAATSSPCGAGRAVRIGTAFFQRYLSLPGPAHVDLLASLLPPTRAPLRLRCPGSHLRLRCLCHPLGKIAIVLNQGASPEVELVSTATGSLQPTEGDARTIAAGEVVRVDVPAGDVRVFVFRREAQPQSPTGAGSEGQSVKTSRVPVE